MIKEQDRQIDKNYDDMTRKHRKRKKKSAIYHQNNSLKQEEVI